MDQAKPKHEWMGTLVIGSHEIGCRLYGAFGKAASPSLERVHRNPCSPPATSSAKSGKKGGGKKSKEEKEDEEETKPGSVLNQPVCMRCHAPLKPDEIGWTVKTPRGIEVPIAKEDMERLEFDRSERVKAELVSAEAATLAALSTGGRRFYAFPEPASMDAYWTVYAALQQAHAVGFIPLLATKTDRGYVAVVRPLVIPAIIFSEEEQEGSTCAVLAVDCLADTDTLKDPRELCGYPENSVISSKVLKETIEAFRSAMSEEITDPTRCVNPSTAKMLRMITRARDRQRRADRE